MVNTKIKLITFFVAEDGEAVDNQQKQVLTLTVAQIISFSQQNSGLKKEEKTTRPVWYGLNQIPYEYAVEVTNRFKGLELVNSAPKELWTEVNNIVWKAVNKTITKKKKSKKAEWLSEEALQIAEEKDEKQGRKGKVNLNKHCVPENSKQR